MPFPSALALPYDLPLHFRRKHDTRPLSPTLSSMLYAVVVLLLLLSTRSNASPTDPEASVLATQDNALDLATSTSVVKLTKRLNINEGTITFWVWPTWTIPTTTAQPLIAFSWRDARRGYFVISQGWWQTVGLSRLTFVLSNQDGLACVTDEQLPVQTWSMVTASWHSGDNGYCKLFIDDRRVAEYRFSHVAPLQSEDTIFLGTDQPTTENFGRRGSAIIRNLKILKTSLTHHDVIEQYQSTETTDQLTRKKWSWMTDSPPIARRYVDGERRTIPIRQPLLAVFEENLAWAVDRSAINDRVDALTSAGVAAYFPCVWYGNFARYPTDVGDVDPTLSPSIRKGWDPMAYLLARARKRGLQIHPWFTIAYRGPDGTRRFSNPGVPDLANDVHSPAFQKYIVRLLDDFVSRYDVDGINLDYVRAMGVCVSDTCLTDYQSAYARSLVHDVALSSTDSLARTRIESWQDEAVSRLISSLSDRLRERSRKILISIDGHIADESERPLEGRNELEWLRNGWIDLVFQMDYGIRLHVKDIDRAVSSSPRANTVAPLIANDDLVDTIALPRSNEWTRRLVTFIDDRWQVPFIGIYDWSHLTHDQLQAIADLTAVNTCLRSGHSVSSPGQTDSCK